jgi:hypothetical protein
MLAGWELAFILFGRTGIFGVRTGLRLTAFELAGKMLWNIAASCYLISCYGKKKNHYRHPWQ